MQVSRHWRMQEQRYNLVAEAPAQDELYTFTGLGEVYSYTTIYDAPAGFEQYAPYTVALVKLNEGPIVTAQLTDVNKDELAIGLPVEMVTRKLRTDGDEGMIVYGYKFRPQVV